MIVEGSLFKTCILQSSCLIALPDFNSSELQLFCDIINISQFPITRLILTLTYFRGLCYQCTFYDRIR
jgi:hypothetical protein